MLCAPCFPDVGLIIAGAFGLVHGMAFATTLGNLGVDAWQRLASIFGFNLGIEAMQLIVVAAILPSLLALAREPAYAVLRVTGALLAGVAALGWISERLLGIPTFVSVLVEALARRSAWVAAPLAVFSILIWLRQNVRAEHGVLNMRRQVELEDVQASQMG